MLKQEDREPCEFFDEAVVNSYVLGKDAGRMQQLVGSIGLLKDGRK
mgnify:CR=1 FL=1